MQTVGLLKIGGQTGGQKETDRLKHRKTGWQSGSSSIVVEIITTSKENKTVLASIRE